MTLDAEVLLLATGLVAEPTASHLAAAPAILRDLQREIAAALDRDKPDRLYLVTLPGNYAKALAKEPDYETFMAFLKPRIGEDDALAYQMAHQHAREVLESRRTKVTMDTIMGPVVLDNDPVSEDLWRWECAQIEQMRIAKDIAAGAVLAANVAVFAACCPEVHRNLMAFLNNELNRRRARTKSWIPDPYLEPGLRTFLGWPQDAAITIEAPKEAPPPAKPGKTGGSGTKSKGIDTDALMTTAQKASK